MTATFRRGSSRHRRRRHEPTLARLQAHWIVVWPEADRRVLQFLVELGYRRVGEADGALLYSR